MSDDNKIQENAFQGSAIDAYDFYKRNYSAAQEVLSSTDFESVQSLGANIANRFRPNTTEVTAMSTEKTSLISNTSFLKGLLVGAGVAFVATNPTVQKAVVTGAVNLFTAFQGSIEEMKEQIQDAKEELSQTDE